MILNDLENDEEIQLPDKIKNYSFRGVIGQGSFSTVYLLYNEEIQEYFACKIIQKKTIRKSHIENLIKNEINNWMELSHPLIVNLIEYYQDQNNLYFIMEYCSNGDLLNLLNSIGRLRESHASKLTKMILEAISYVHSHNVAHRDLKPENILFDKFGNIKIADFGLSTKVENYFVENFCGSLGYISPECFFSSFYDSKKCDIWAIGVIVYSMVTDSVPWDLSDPKKLLNQMDSEEYSFPSYVSKNCQNFISSLLKSDPDQRMTIDECFKHPWITGDPIRTGLELSCIRKSHSKQIFSPISDLKKPKMRLDKSSIFANVSPKKNPQIRIRKRKKNDEESNLALNLHKELVLNDPIRKGLKKNCEEEKEIKKSIYFPPINS